MRSKRTLGRVALAVALATGALLTPPASAAVTAAPTQEYDGHLEEANAWAIEALNLPAAWETTRGEGVTIAVMDTGMGNHPYFEDKDVLPGYSAYNPDDEEDAWYDRPSGWDPAIDGSDPDIEDKQGHGTAVTSQVLLAAPEATILPVRDGTGVADGIGNLFLDGATEIDAVRWAVDNGADAIVMAWGVPGETNEDMYMAMQYAVDHDVILIASAGNEPEDLTTEWFPAFLRGVVTVSGLAEDGGGWEQSTTGPEVDVAAPADYTLAVPVPQGNPHLNEDCEFCSDDTSYQGDETLGTRTPELYMETGGTSLAVGWVGGVVALIKAAHPELDADNVVQRLLQTAADRGDTGRDDVFGHGVPDAAAAVGADVEPVDGHPLGYPLGVPGASGVSVTGEPAPGTGATADGAASSSDSPGSDAVPLVVVAALAAVFAGAGWFLLQKRSGGATGRSLPRSELGLGVAVTVVFALVAAGGTYLAADTVVDKGSGGAAESASDGGGGADSSTDSTDEAGATGELASDGNPAATAAKAWQDAYTAGDLETFRSLTCENPWYRVAINIKKLEDPSFVRPGFAILIQDGDYWGPDDYRVVRQSDGKAWVEAGNISIGSGADYQIALVREDGEWKACDFWWTSSGGWQGIPEWEGRFPRDGGDDSIGLSGLQES